MRALCRRFSTPGGIPSHVSVQTPGSIHEGGELGYVLSHAFGAAFDNPDLIVAAVVGDGEAETGPLAGGWRGTRSSTRRATARCCRSCTSTATRSAARPCWAATSDEDIRACLQGNGYEAHFVEGDDPERVLQAFAATLDRCYERIRAIQQAARQHGFSERPRWPAIVLRTPKGGPAQGSRRAPVEGTFRSHQVPMADTAQEPRAAAHARDLAALLPAGGAVRPGRQAHPRARRAVAAGRPPHERQPARERRQGAEGTGHPRLPRLRASKWTWRSRPPRAESTRQLGKLLRDVYTSQRRGRRTSACSAPTRRTPTGSATSSRSRTVASSAAMLDIDDHVSPDGRVMEVLSEHNCEGGWRAICSPGGTASSRPTRRSRWSRRR